MEGHVNCIVHRPVGSVGKLQGVQKRVCDGFKVCQQQALERLHYHRGQGDGSVVIKSCWLWLFGHRDDGGGLETGWHMACLQGGVKYVGEHRRQLVSTVLEGGRRDRVRPSCFAGVLPLEGLLTSPS